MKKRFREPKTQESRKDATGEEATRVSTVQRDYHKRSPECCEIQTGIVDILFIL